jgi:hypothetical protein
MLVGIVIERYSGFEAWFLVDCGSVNRISVADVSRI